MDADADAGILRWMPDVEKGSWWLVARSERVVACLFREGDVRYLAGGDSCSIFQNPSVSKQYIGLQCMAPVTAEEGEVERGG